MATTRADPELMTAENLATLPDDDHRYDLIRGELLRVGPAGGEHGQIGMGIGARLWLHVTQHALGVVYAAETGFVLAHDPDTILGPDAAFVRADRLPPAAQQRGFVNAVPDLAVEVVSPGDRSNEVTDKVMEYLDAGVSLVWVVYPRRKIVMVYRSDRVARILSGDDVLDGGDVVPGFSVRVAELFP
jgi:Uma2 family endonuclease